MRKSGWAAATGLGSLVLLLAACGGSSSSSTSATGAATGTTQATATSSALGTSSSASASASAGKSGSSGSSAAPKAHRSAVPQPSSAAGYSFPPQGTTFMAVARTAIGYVLAEANGQVVYTYASDKKNGAPTCTGSCAATWPPVTGTPKEGPAFSIPGTFGVVRGPGGVQQVTYNGYPLYLYKGAKPHVASGSGVAGWHVIPMSASDIRGA